VKIAIMGIRGIPANYGGFETFIEQMAPRLAERGHEVTVFGRSNIIDYREPFYKGVRIRILPTISHKYLDTVVHTLVCTLCSFFIPYDVVFICNSANAAFCILPRLAGKPVILNVDGLEWKRQKWNWAGKAFYRISEFLATFAPTAVVSDAREVQSYYQEKFQKESTYIPYGAPETPVGSRETLDRFGLEEREYVLYVSRMEPENNAHRVVEAFEKVKTDKKLVMVGDAPYASDYIAGLRATRDPRIIFTGYIFGQGYRELQSHAYCYVWPPRWAAPIPPCWRGWATATACWPTTCPNTTRCWDKPAAISPPGKEIRCAPGFSICSTIPLTWPATVRSSANASTPATPGTR